ncbi:hypothetical protein HanPSC8_Chr10g0420021 [Helianthus annuus]|nr:hypothetical protein HanPSC8_Chr10g0420021 [Helianthus annuus]
MLLGIFLQLGSMWLKFLVFLFWLSSRCRKSQDRKLSEGFFFFFFFTDFDVFVKEFYL